jgi:hypothetical protein
VSDGDVLTRQRSRRAVVHWLPATPSHARWECTAEDRWAKPEFPPVGPAHAHHGVRICMEVVRGWCVRSHCRPRLQHGATIRLTHPPSCTRPHLSDDQDENTSCNDVGLLTSGAAGGATGGCSSDSLRRVGRGVRNLRGEYGSTCDQLIFYRGIPPSATNL